MTDYNDGKWHAHEARQGRPDSIKPESIVEVFGHQRTLAGNKAPFHQVAPSSHIVFPYVSAFRVVKPYQEPKELWMRRVQTFSYVTFNCSGLVNSPVMSWEVCGPDDEGATLFREVLPTDPS